MSAQDNRSPILVEEWLFAAKKKIGMADAEIIATKCFAPSGSDKSWLVTHNRDKVNNLTRAYADTMLDQRAEGLPMAYVMGKKEFYGRDFLVSKDVLIPRPETEDLIDLIKELELPRNARFLDVGTGSGCIGITLALEYPQSEVVATDISGEALEIAQKNDDRLEGRVTLIRSDLLELIDVMIDGKFNVIVANLPYVNPSWEWLDTDALGYEPTVALYAVGKNGLALYYRFFAELSKAKDNLGAQYVVVEADPCQHQELIRMAAGYGWDHHKTRGFGLVFRKTA